MVKQSIEVLRQSNGEGGYLEIILREIGEGKISVLGTYDLKGFRGTFGSRVKALNWVGEKYPEFLG